MWKDCKTQEAMEHLATGGKAKPANWNTPLIMYDDEYILFGGKKKTFCMSPKGFFADAKWQIWIEPPSEKERLDHIFNLMDMGYTQLPIHSVDEISKWFVREKQIREEK